MSFSRWKYADEERYQATKQAYYKRYYEKTATHCPIPWTAEQDALVLAHNITDRELSKMIGHSMKAIQIRRCRLKKDGTGKTI